jgi:hypothetical protein
MLACTYIIKLFHLFKLVQSDGWPEASEDSRAAAQEFKVGWDDCIHAASSYNIYAARI